MPALDISALHGNPKRFEPLLQRSAELTTRVTNRNITHRAAAGGSRIICEIILEWSRLSWNELAPSDISGTEGPMFAAPIHIAAYTDNLEVLKFLVQKLLAPNLDLKCPGSGFTPFLLAAQGGASTVVEFLYKNSVDIHARISTGETALHLAVGSVRFSSSLLQSLLDYGIDAESKTVSC